MKCYFIDMKGHRREVTKSNVSEYLMAKDRQWVRIYNKLRIRSGEREIESLQNDIALYENALEDNADKWNNHRDEVYAEYILAGWTKDEIDKDWEEHLAELPELIANKKKELIEMEIDMNLACRPGRTAKEFEKRFRRDRFIEDLETKVMKELNV